MNIFIMEIKKSLKSLAVWSIVSTALIILFMSMFSSMKSSGMQQLMSTEMSAMPEAVLKAFNLKDMPDFTKLSQYFAYVFQYIMMAGCIYAGILGSKSLIKEESEGTIEFLYAQPVTRTKIVTMKLLSAIVLFYFYVVIISLGSLSVSLAVKPEDLKLIDMVTDYTMLFSGLLLAGLVFMALGFLTSVIVPHLRVAVPMTIGFFFVSYTFGIFSAMIEKLEFLKYFSPFHYAVPSEVIKHGFDNTNLLLASVIIVICTVLVYIIYKRKDFRI